MPCNARSVAMGASSTTVTPGGTTDASSRTVAPVSTTGASSTTATPAASIYSSPTTASEVKFRSDVESPPEPAGW